MVDAVAPINIALLKYWGKYDELNIHPFADSISLTLDPSQIHSRTRISVSCNGNHSFFLNGQQINFSNRMKDVIIVAQKRALIKGTYRKFHYLHIESENNFPTGAGLASSASGMASLAHGLSKFYNLKDDDASSLARRGSGSAGRSMFGGFVHWMPTSESSFSYQLFPHNHWPELRVLICVTDPTEKSIGSTAAMRRTLLTSPLFRSARKNIVKERLKLFQTTIEKRDFSSLAELTMRESNELHAVCLDSYPPVFYMNRTSLALIEIVHLVNRAFQRNLAAYTFDAGPNAFVLAQEEDIPLLLAVLIHCFSTPPKTNTTVGDTDNSCQVLSTLRVDGLQYSPFDLSGDKFSSLLSNLPQLPGAVRYVISTKVGPGPH